MVARVLLSRSTFTRSLASMAWWRPSLYRRPNMRRPGNITYGTNNEMGFDYLRDNMALYSGELVQRGHNFAIVDEVDSILIDEARTPLIISGMGDKSTQLYDMAEMFVRPLKKLVIAETDEKAEEDVNIDADYVVDEKAKTATLTARGIAKGTPPPR